MVGPRSPNEDATRPEAFGDSRANHVRVLAVWEGGTASAWVPRGRSVRIGRSKRCELIVDHPSVSREHAEIAVTRPYTVRDLGSVNGVRVRGRLLSQGVTQSFDAGDVVELGSVVIVVRDLQDEAAASARSASIPPGEPSSEKDPMQAIESLLAIAAPSDIPILVLGETGVGKTLIAERAHQASRRAAGPLLRINCAALPEALLEGELFGFEKGAFSGAIQAKPGLLESADGGTVFLDEIGEMPLVTQAKLLGVLDSGEVQRLGSLRPRRFDVRWIAATNRDLVTAVRGGTFRADLLFRLDGIRLAVPPLRTRPLAITELARTFAARAAEKAGRAVPSFSRDADAWLLAHPWPGNVRELKHTIERASLLAPSGVIERVHLARDDGSMSTPLESASPRAGEGLQHELASVERRRIEEALDATRGNQTEAARLLGISRRALITRLDTFNLPRPRKR